MRSKLFPNPPYLSLPTMAMATETIHEHESERNDKTILPKFPTPTAHSRSPARRASSNTTVTVDSTTHGGGLKDKLARAMSPRRGSQTRIDGPLLGGEYTSGFDASPGLYEPVGAHKLPLLCLFFLVYHLPVTIIIVQPVSIAFTSILLAHERTGSHFKTITCLLPRKLTLGEYDWLNFSRLYL